MHGNENEVLAASHCTSVVSFLSRHRQLSRVPEPVTRIANNTERKCTFLEGNAIVARVHVSRPRESMLACDVVMTKLCSNSRRCLRNGFCICRTSKSRLQSAREACQAFCALHRFHLSTRRTFSTLRAGPRHNTILNVKVIPQRFIIR